MRDRHSALETVVFGLAGLLALILAYYTYARWSSRRPAPTNVEAPAADVPAPYAPAATGEDDDSAGFRGGGSVPTVRFSQPKRRGKK